MKRLLLPFVLMAMCSAAFAQKPQLTSDEMLPFGAKMRFKYVQNTYDIDTAKQGENVTWDFSGLINSSTPDLSITVADPSKTPYASSFPDANYAWIESPTAYRYFNLSSSRMQRVGSYTTSVSTYNDPQIEYVFPLTYGTESFDTWDNTKSSWGGRYDFKCISTGKLITPGGTFNNTLLVRAIVSEGEIYTFPSYFWYDADNGAILLNYSPGDGFFIGTHAMYMSNLNTSIGENDLAGRVYFNNPVQNSLNIELPDNNGDINNYTIYNIFGQAVLQGNSKNASFQVDVNALPAGTYILTLTNARNAEEVFRTKFVKQ